MPPPAPWLWYIILIISFNPFSTASFATLTDDDLRNIPSPGDDFDIANGALLAPILIPRVPGTDNSLKVQRHFLDFFREQLPDWEVIQQNSTSKTPATGERDVPFVNLVFRRDPPWAKEGDVGRLTLVAHYDSLIKPEGFIGAIDSAAPCAMLMHVARSVDEALTKKWEAMAKSGEGELESPKGVQILLLDGEEAFVHWSKDDSLYGARSLAEEWDTKSYGTMSGYKTPLQSISLFVLLDLLGSVDCRVPSYFLPTHWAYKSMAMLEKRMRDLEILEGKRERNLMPDSDKKTNLFTRGYVEDDHVPFMQRGVEILHLIPTPFPKVWHKMEDDGEHLDLATCRDWAKIVTAFTVEWMEVNEHMPKLAPAKEETSGAERQFSKRKEL